MLKGNECQIYTTTNDFTIPVEIDKLEVTAKIKKIHVILRLPEKILEKFRKPIQKRGKDKWDCDYIQFQNLKLNTTITEIISNTVGKFPEATISMLNGHFKYVSTINL
jgi:hypothetical protein